MNRMLFSMEYYETYYYINLIHCLLTDSFSYLPKFEEFFGDMEYKKFLSPFPRHNALRKFIEFTIETVVYESIDDLVEDSLVQDRDYELWINSALNIYGIEHINFRLWLTSIGATINDISEDKIIEYIEFLRIEGLFDQLVERISEEVFFIIFLNRELLRKFNEEIASRIRYIETNDLSSDEKKFFRRTGALKRSRIPVWARRAVFYRDRGVCVSCHRDISGLVSIHSEKHYDHIVPLARGGINDVTNLQLLCDKCNLNKNANPSFTSKYYERWYL